MIEESWPACLRKIDVWCVPYSAEMSGGSSGEPSGFSDTAVWIKLVSKTRAQGEWPRTAAVNA